MCLESIKEGRVAKCCLLKQTAPTVVNFTEEVYKNICLAICDFLAAHQVFTIHCKKKMIALTQLGLPELQPVTFDLA